NALEEVGGGCCDTCLSRRSRVAARQQVNQICRRLEDAGTITRGETTCGVCGAAKTVSVLADTSHQRRKPRPSAADVSHSPSPEEMRNQLDRFCTGLWEKRGSGQKPDALAALIAELSDRGAIPMHQANMMHTVRALRNASGHPSPTSSVPASLAPRVTPAANRESWSTVVLIVSSSSASSPVAPTVIIRGRSPRATAVATAAMLRTWFERLSASVFTFSVRP